MMTSKDIMKIRDRVWRQVRDIPGVRNIAVRPNRTLPEGVELVLHVDFDKLDERQLPKNKEVLRIALTQDHPAVSN